MKETCRRILILAEQPVIVLSKGNTFANIHQAYRKVDLRNIGFRVLSQSDQK